MAKQGLNPRFNASREIPSFEEIAGQVHIDRMPTWKNAKHGQQWINTLRDYAFPKIGRMPVDSVGQPEVLMCLSPIWTEKHETARRLAQRIKVVLDVAKSKGFRDGENPVTAIKDANVLPKVTAKPKHHSAMHWKNVPALYADLGTRNAMAAKALMFTCLTVRFWRAQGLIVMAGRKPHYILGEALIEFLEQRQKKRSVKMAIDQVFCLSCRAPKRPMGMLVDYIPITSERGRLEAICEVCGGTCQRFVSAASLTALSQNLDIARRKPPHA